MSGLLFALQLAFFKSWSDSKSLSVEWAYRAGLLPNVTRFVVAKPVIGIWNLRNFAHSLKHVFPKKFL